MYEEMSLLNASLVSRLDPRLKADIIIPVSSEYRHPQYMHPGCIFSHKYRHQEYRRPGAHPAMKMGTPCKQH